MNIPIKATIEIKGGKVIKEVYSFKKATIQNIKPDLLLAMSQTNIFLNEGYKQP